MSITAEINAVTREELHRLHDQIVQRLTDINQERCLLRKQIRAIDALIEAMGDPPDPPVY